MSLDADRLRHGLFLATGRPGPLEEAAQLGATLGVTQEALAFVLLRRDGFADCPGLQAELAQAAARAGGPLRAGRPPRIVDAVSASAAAAELHSALKALIEDNLEAAPQHWRADEALRELAELSPAAAYDAILRFQPGEWREVRRERRAARPPSRSPAASADRRRAAIQRYRRRKARKD